MLGSDKGFDINRAARMLRAGNEFSETNRKLREAAISFVEWLYEKLTEFQLPSPEAIGWKLERDSRTGFILLHFERRSWHTVSNNRDYEQMNAVVELCRAIAGPEGERLTAWLEEQDTQRRRMLDAFTETLRRARRELNPSASAAS